MTDEERVRAMIDDLWTIGQTQDAAALESTLADALRYRASYCTHCRSLPDAARAAQGEDDPIVVAQHDETGRFWHGRLSQLPPRYIVVRRNPDA